MQSSTLKTFLTNEGRKKRFIKKLKEDYDIDESELPFFKYCGAGNNDYIKKYFKNYDWTDDLLLDLQTETECVCGQNIKHPFYIADSRVDEPDIIVLGSECIKSFTVFGKKRFCITCSAEHKNRNYSECNKCLSTCNCGGHKQKGSDKCKECLALICGCGKPKPSKYKTCWDCKPKFKCPLCNKTTYSNKYPTCWDCKNGGKYANFIYNN